MARKHVPDTMVIQAALDRNNVPGRPWLYDLLMERSGQCFKVCYRAMERTYAKRYIECGVSLRTAWATDEGKAYLAAQTIWIAEKRVQLASEVEKEYGLALGSLTKGKP